jgi:hypothetical protein
VIRRHGSKAVVVATCQLSVKVLPFSLGFVDAFASYDVIRRWFFGLEYLVANQKGRTASGEAAL